MIELFNRFFYIDKRSLTGFRIALGLVVIYDLLMRLSDLKAHYTDDGVLPLKVLFEYNWNPSFWSLATASGALYFQFLLFIAVLGCAVLLIAGYHTRLMAFLCWAGILSIQNRNPILYQGGDDLLRMLLFFSVFLPKGIDKNLAHDGNNPDRYTSVVTMMILLQILYAFQFSGIFKDSWEWWYDATAIYYAFSLDQITRPLGIFILHHYNFTLILTRAVYLFELLILPIFLIPFGREYVRLLVAAGANVVLADVNEAVAQQTAGEIGLSDQLLVAKTDVGSIEACDACAAAATERFGGVDYLVNNAGPLSAAAHRSLIAVDPQVYLSVLNIMTHGMLWMTRAVFPSMKARGGGAIVNISSVGAYMATGLYSVAKVGVNALTISLAHELAADNIRVNAIAPGTVNTEGMKPLMSVEQMAQWGRSGGRPTDHVAAPAEIARVGLFLLSDAASYIRGQIISVDDGQQIRL